VKDEEYVQKWNFNCDTKPAISLKQSMQSEAKVTTECLYKLVYGPGM